jgi:hypothetical protein
MTLALNQFNIGTIIHQPTYPSFFTHFYHKGMNDDNSCVPPPPSHDNDFTHERNAPLKNQLFCQIKIGIPTLP